MPSSDWKFRVSSAVLLLSACGGAQTPEPAPSAASTAGRPASQVAPTPEPKAATPEPTAATPPPAEPPAPKQDAKLEQVFADPQYQLTGVAISAKGRLFVNYPIWSPVHKYCVVEVLPGGQVKPYPNEEMNSWKEGDDGTKK